MSSHENFPFFQPQPPHPLDQNSFIDLLPLVGDSVGAPLFPATTPYNNHRSNLNLPFDPQFNQSVFPQEEQFQQLLLQHRHQQQRLQSQQQQQQLTSNPFNPFSSGGAFSVGVPGSCNNNTNNKNSVSVGIQSSSELSEPSSSSSSSASYSYAAAVARNGGGGRYNLNNTAVKLVPLHLNAKEFVPSSNNYKEKTSGSNSGKADIKLLSLFSANANIPRAAKRKASVEKVETCSKSKQELETNKQEQEKDEDDSNNNTRKKVDEDYALSFIPGESYFRLQMFERKDIIKDQLATLLKRTREYCVGDGIELEVLYGCFTPPTVRVVFALSQRLGVNMHTFFCAVEIFDKFTTMHNSIVRDLLKKDDQLGATRRRDVLRVRVPLRIATCIHLAAKLHTDDITPDLKIPRIVDVLKVINGDCDKEDIKKSEYKIFSTLNFRLTWPQPLEIIEVTLAALDLLVEVRMGSYSNCVCILFFAYQHHHELYDELWDTQYHKNEAKSAYIGNRRQKNVVGKGIQAARKEFREKIESNIILRSGAIVATSLIINPKTNQPDSVPHGLYIRQIAKLLEISDDSIFELSISLLKLIFQDGSFTTGLSSSPLPSVPSSTVTSSAAR